MSESEDEDDYVEEDIDVEEELPEEEEIETEADVAEYAYDGSSDVSDQEDVVQKFDTALTEDRIASAHPQEKCESFEDVKPRLAVTRDVRDIVQDVNHTTLPILTKYEYTRILGLRAKQINDGAPLFVDTALVDGYLIAQLELRAKKLPFIIRRPLPNGDHEFWNVSDLELLF